ncbi:tyrosine-type recombinase/integrase [Chloroflexota bacterium]
MPEMKPKTKANKDEQLTGSLKGELATYEKVGLFQRSVSKNTVYRYRGALLRYQKALQGAKPTLKASKIFLAHMRKQGYSPSTIRVHRAALKGFHEWRGENLVFPIKIPRHLPPYIEASLVTRMLDLAREIPRDYLILRLMSDAGMRREEVVDLVVKNVGEKALRFRGKGNKDRTVPLTKELAETLKPFCSGKGPDDRVVGVGEGVIYRVVKQYGRLADKPEMTPHKLRHAFATRLLEKGVNIRIIQELMGHSNVNTTQDYTAVSASHLEEAIKTLNQPRRTAISDDTIEKVMELLAKIDTKDKPPEDSTGGISPVVY